MNNIPLSIKIIGWYYIVIGVLLIILSLVLAAIKSTTSGQIADAVGLPFSFGFSIGLAENLLFNVFILGIFFGVFNIFLGKYLFKRNTIAWVLILLVVSVTVLYTIVSAITNNKIPNLISLVISGLIIWKLIEHKGIFLRG